MVNGPWGGYKNGQIPISAGVAIPWTHPAQHIRKEWLPGVIAFGNAFKKKFGAYPDVTEAYRNLITQDDLWDGWKKHLAGVPGYEYYNLAAWPGTSIHGWMEAIDFGSGINLYGSAQKKWADANGPKYGLIPTGNSFSPREAWHYEWNGKVYVPPKATPTKKERAEVKAYHNQDRTVKKLAPGSSVNMMNGKVPQNVTGIVGTYSITLHVYVDDLAALHDAVDVVLVWRNPRQPKDSNHYVQRVSADANGQIRANVEFKRPVVSGDQVLVRVTAAKTNTRTGEVTVIDSDAYAFLA
jgi:hypothetical protein